MWRERTLGLGMASVYDVPGTSACSERIYSTVSAQRVNIGNVLFHVTAQPLVA